jgi:two-component system, OmpR family, sensor kinase
VSLRLRLAAIFAVLLILTVAGFGLILFLAMGRALSAEMDRRLEVRASQVQLTIWPGTETLSVDGITSARLDLSPLLSLNAPTVYVQVVSPEGEVLARTANLEAAEFPVEPESLASARTGRRGFGDLMVEDGHPVRILSVPIYARDRIAGVLQVGQSRLPLHRTMKELGTLLLALGLVAGALGAVVCLWVAGRGLRPLQTVAQRAREIAQQRNFHHRVGPLPQTDEVGQLARTVDYLLETVEGTLSRHREFVADTSHELRNPLLAIQTNLELLRKVESPTDQLECLEEASEQVRRMSRLVADLLLLAREDASQVVELQLVALNALVERAAGQARHGAEGRIIAIGECDPLHLKADEVRVAQMLANLVDNAIQHTSPTGHITLSLVQEGGWARITVADDGDGIPEADLPHIFERFYRSPRGKRRNSYGTGLGLAIVKHLAEAHGGRVTVESIEGIGSAFSIWLPLTPTRRKKLRVESPLYGEGSDAWVGLSAAS